MSKRCFLDGVHFYGEMPVHASPIRIVRKQCMIQINKEGLIL